MGGTFSLKRIGGALWPQVQFCVSVITLHWLERNAKDIFGYLLENFLLRRKFSFHFNQARINYSDSSKQKATGFGYRVTGWQKLRSRSTGGARKVRKRDGSQHTLFFTFCPDLRAFKNAFIEILTKDMMLL